MSTEERIKQDAIQIAKDELDNNKPYPSWEYLIEKGALSERNKVIEEIQTNLMQNWHKKSADEIYDLLQSLKV